MWGIFFKAGTWVIKKLTTKALKNQALKGSVSKTKEGAQAVRKALKEEVKAAKRGETTIPPLPSKVADAAPYVGGAGIAGFTGARAYNEKSPKRKGDMVKQYARGGGVRSPQRGI